MKHWVLSLLLTLITIIGSPLFPAAPVQATLAAEYEGYVVQPGDTLTRIAARHGVTVSALAAANGLPVTAWVYAGQQLQLPVPLTHTPAPSGVTYVVQPGDTLLTIALRHGVTTRELAAFNGLALNSWVYVGQQLAIPGNEPVTVAPPEEPVVEAGGEYVVKAGNTLYSIARWHGVTVAELRAANGLSSNTIYVGQRLRIPGSGETPATDPTPPPVPELGTSGDKWIDVNLTTQTVTAYEGHTPVHSALASTGTWRTPTVVGTYHVYAKYPATPMSGPGYYLPNVPHTMYFHRGFAIHGAYWHNNFGTPMSHGCVNLSLPDAEWFYNWAPIGTKVVTHY